VKVPIRVIIVDDHHVVRRGLMFFLKTQKDIEIVGEAVNGYEAIRLVEKTKPDLVLMDLVMPEMDGVEATKQIKERFPETKILILTSFSDEDHVISAIRAGAAGYQLKDIEPDVLVNVIRSIYKGESQLHPKATTHVMAQFLQNNHKDVNHLDELTKREMEVLSEITKGKSNKEIAASLCITEKTVKTHVSNLLSKLELQDRTQAALYAVKHGLE
jgi:DNA-binding NarL/FixJ family response regulator